MSVELQVALFLASAGIVALVVCLVPILLQVRRQLELLVRTAEQLKANLDLLVHDTRDLVHNVNELTRQANEQMEDVAHVVGHVRQWSDRADRLINEVGLAIEPPVFSFVRNLNLFRTGLSVFLETLLCSRKHNPTEEEEAQWLTTIHRR
jgi:ABC-type transporter Mla subunit MlaD